MASDHDSSAVVVCGITLAIIQLSGLAAVEGMMFPAYLPGKPLNILGMWLLHAVHPGWWSSTHPKSSASPGPSWNRNWTKRPWRKSPSLAATNGRCWWCSAGSRELSGRGQRCGGDLKMFSRHCQIHRFFVYSVPVCWAFPWKYFTEMNSHSLPRSSRQAYVRCLLDLVDAEQLPGP